MPSRDHFPEEVDLLPVQHRNVKINKACHLDCLPRDKTVGVQTDKIVTLCLKSECCRHDTLVGSHEENCSGFDKSSELTDLGRKLTKTINQIDLIN